MLAFLTGLLAQMKLEDVLRSTQDSFKESPSSNRLFALVLGVVGVVIVLLLVHHRLKRQAAPKPLNNQRKLLREVTRNLPLRRAEMKQLKALAEQQGCSSPLVLLLCPSLLDAGIRQRTGRADPRILGRVARKVGVR